MHLIWILNFAFALAITPQEDASVRTAFLFTPQTPPLVSVVDAKLFTGLAYTASDLRRVYVDFSRLRKTPNTRLNVLLHELAHTAGATHGDGTSRMAYASRETPTGEVLEDSFVLM